MPEPRLRQVGEDETATPQVPGGRLDVARGRGPTWIPVVLGVALVVALAVLVWSRVQMSERIAVLQDEVRALEVQVERRDGVIAAQRGRLGDVKLRVEELSGLLERPLPDVD